MIFEASRAKAVDKLNTFVEQNLSDYSKLRNFDFGPSNRSNVSCLSPYITHGIINELEVINKSLKKFSFAKNEKFIQEVLWRVYWKGWLELRPDVWSDYLIELNKIKKEFKNNQSYLDAMSLYGYTTKRDLTKLGSFLMMGLIGIIVASVVNMFLKSSMMDFVISILGVLIFVGLTAYDTQKIKNMYVSSDTGELMG
ncbi:Bax inhibitor-1/YccA family protein, partial [Candidatus Pelagibacter ubique]|nr:Bax inhibitor-1/YccA family protein [Candidatus Pelagibacter ubique]